MRSDRVRRVGAGLTMPPQVRALAIAREISVRLEEARALEGLGHCLLPDGDHDDGAAHWQQALAIYERIGAPDAQRIRETLRKHGITTAPPPPSSESRQSA